MNNARPSILVVEDNPDIVKNLYAYLEPLGYIVDSARDGLTGLHLMSANDYDAIILDLMLPGVDGLQLCKRLRADGRRDTPVIMLTARDTVEDKVLGLESGADDYLVKPFSLQELEARIKALIRRASGAHVDPRIRLGSLELDTGGYEARREGKLLDLTPTGLKILTRMMLSYPRLVTQKELEHEIWSDEPPDSGALRAHIHVLRSALDKPFGYPMLKTVRGIGFKLVLDDGS